LIKSASYLLHSGNFTTVRDYILANSATVIQDDSGIPLTYYNAKQWRFFPFGRFSVRSANSRDVTSSPMASCSARAEPINFGIGYRWRTNESNLLLSVRLPTDGTGAGGDHLIGRSASATAAAAEEAEAAAAGAAWIPLFRALAHHHQRTLWLGTMKAAVLVVPVR